MLSGRRSLLNGVSTALPVLMIGALLSLAPPPATDQPRLPATVQVNSTIDYRAELQRRFAPNADSAELDILLNGPHGKAYRSLVDGARFGEKLYSSEDEMQVAMATLYSGLLGETAGFLIQGGLKYLQTALYTFTPPRRPTLVHGTLIGAPGPGEQTPFAIAAIIELGLAGSDFYSVAGEPSQVQAFRHQLAARDHRRLLQIYTGERSNGATIEDAWSDAQASQTEGMLSLIADQMGVAETELPAAIERHYQLGRLSFDPDMIGAVRMGLDAAVAELRSYRSTRTAFKHLIAGDRGVQVVNNGRQALKVTYLAGDTVIGFAALEVGESRTATLDRQWSEITDVLLEVDNIGSWKTTFNDYHVDNFSDEIAVEGAGASRTLSIDRILRRHSGTPPTNTISWSFGAAGTGTGNPATADFTCPGSYRVDATITSGTLPAISRTTPVTVADDWNTAVSTDRDGIIAPDTPVVFTATGQFPAGVAFRWSFPDGTTATGPTTTKSFTSLGEARVVLTVTQGTASTCVRTAQARVYVGDVQYPLPSTISRTLQLQPYARYIAASGGTTVTATGRLIAPAGTRIDLGRNSLIINGDLQLDGTSTGPVTIRGGDAGTLVVGSGGRLLANHASFVDTYGTSSGSWDVQSSTMTRSGFSVNAPAGSAGWNSTALAVQGTSRLYLEGGSHRLVNTSYDGTGTPIDIAGSGASIDGLTAPSSAVPVSVTAQALAGTSLRRLSGAAGAVIDVYPGFLSARTAVVSNIDLPYRLLYSSASSLTVPVGGRLQVLPGVRLLSDNMILVRGALDIIGTDRAAARVTGYGQGRSRITLAAAATVAQLTSANAVITGTSIDLRSKVSAVLNDTHLDGSSFYAELADGTLRTERLQMTGAGMRVLGGAPTMVDTTFTGASSGVWFDGNTTATVDGLVATGIAEPVTLSPGSSDSTFSRLVGSTGAALRVMPGTYPRRVLNWNATAWPYLLTGPSSASHQLSSGTQLNVGPGVRVQGLSAPLVLAGGGLTAAGTEQTPVTLSQFGSSWPGISGSSGTLALNHTQLTRTPVTLNGVQAVLRDTHHDTSPMSISAGAVGAAVDAERVSMHAAGLTLRGGTHRIHQLAVGGFTGTGLSLESGARATVDGFTSTGPTIITDLSSSSSEFTGLSGPAGSVVQVLAGTLPAGLTQWSGTDWPYSLLGGVNVPGVVINDVSVLRLGAGVQVRGTTALNIRGGTLELAGERQRKTTIAAPVQLSNSTDRRAVLRAEHARFEQPLVTTGADVTLTRSTLPTLDLRSASTASVRYTSLGTHLVADATSSADAVQNWWGSASGPAPRGAGSAVSGPVAYEPWCTVADCIDLDPEADREPPTVTGTPDRPANEHGWYAAPVTVTWAATDRTAAGQVSLPAPPATTAADEGANQLLQSSPVCDQASNCAAGSYRVSVDLTAPHIAATLLPSPNSAGWSNRALELSYTCTDAISGVAACPIARTITTEGPSTAIGTVTDAAGHTDQVTTSVRVDTIAPKITVSGPADGQTVPAGTAVAPACSATDDGSGLAAECTVAVNRSATEAGIESYTAVATARDIAGNESRKQWSYRVLVDVDAPSIESVIEAAPNSAGWYAEPVTVRFTCSDTSGVQQCPEPIVFDQDGTNQSATVSATDVHGNTGSSTVSGISVDRTPPTVRLSTSKPTYTVDDTVRVSCTATDSTSGVATSTCMPSERAAVDVGVGVHTVEAVVTDVAGHRTATSVTFEVVATPTSVAALVDEFAGAGSGAARSMRNTLQGGNVEAFRAQVDAFCCTGQAKGQSKPLSSTEAAVLRKLASALAAA